jgi:hypothetical protein
VLESDLILERMRDSVLTIGIKVKYKHGVDERIDEIVDADSMKQFFPYVIKKPSGEQYRANDSMLEVVDANKNPSDG